MGKCATLKFKFIDINHSWKQQFSVSIDWVSFRCKKVHLNFTRADLIDLSISKSSISPSFHSELLVHNFCLDRFWLQFKNELLHYYFNCLRLEMALRHALMHERKPLWQTDKRHEHDDEVDARHFLFDVATAIAAYCSLNFFSLCIQMNSHIKMNWASLRKKTSFCFSFSVSCVCVCPAATTFIQCRWTQLSYERYKNTTEEEKKHLRKMMCTTNSLQYVHCFRALLGRFWMVLRARRFYPLLHTLCVRVMHFICVCSCSGAAFSSPLWLLIVFMQFGLDFRPVFSLKTVKSTYAKMHEMGVQIVLLRIWP